jgi:GNAT superfamily N-acetyltransferase
MAPHFRRARPDEADALRVLIVRSMGHWPRDPEYLAEAARLMSLSADDLDRDEAWVLEEGGVAIGFYRVSIDGSRAEIKELHLEPQFIGRGFGRALFKHCVTRAKQRGIQHLEWTCDRNARGFYLAMGGKVIGTRPSGIAGDEPLTLMELHLD